MIRARAAVLAALWLASAPFAAYGEAVAPRETAVNVIEQTNAFRTAEGLAPVKINDALGDAAQRFAGYMASTGRYGHHADSRTPAERAAAEGYEHCIVSENIAYQYRSTGFESATALARAFVEGWTHSTGHRRNMLDPAVTEIGTGIVRDASGRYFAVQMFGRPREAAIRFAVSNRSAGELAYRAGEESYSLAPRAVRTHVVCRPTELEIARAAQEKPFSVRVENGIRYAVLDDRVVAEPDR